MKLQLSFLFLFIGLITFAQSEETLKKDAKLMYQASYNMNFETVLDLTYPKIFDLASREQLGQILRNSFQNEQFNIRLVFPEVTFKYGKTKEIEGKKAVLITYVSAMRMTFEQKFYGNEAQEMLMGLKQSLPEKKVSYEPNTNSFFIEGTDAMIAISDNHTNQSWKFITYDKVQRPMLVQMLGENLLNELGL